MEFDIHEETLRKRLRQSSAEAGTDGKFSTAQICAARFGDYEQARARNETAKAERAEMELRVRRDELIDRHKALEDWGTAITAAKNIIQNSTMSKLEKRNVLTALADLGKVEVVE